MKNTPKIILCTLISLFGIYSQAQQTAHAVIQSCSDPDLVIGEAMLEEQDSEEGIKVVNVRLSIDKPHLTSGKHAVHIHENAVCEPCGDAKGHFDPGPMSNSSPDGNHPFHSGDLINIEINDEGIGEMSTSTTRVTLSPGPLSLFDENGSAFIVHVDPDTYCPEGEAAGCAGGARAACGIIQPGMPTENQEQNSSSRETSSDD
ncbi:MAG: superoxide dismutase family protein [Gammaproteobacteria bacterium]|nr:superoxide dismutase family protein [Gammaproteobacteria bacterium]